MPTYDYLCPNEHRFEVIHSVTADGPATCPICGAAPVRKAFSAPTFHFKGTGWAKKDRSSASRSASRAAAASSDGGSGSDSGTASSSPAAADPSADKSAGSDAKAAPDKAPSGGDKAKSSGSKTAGGPAAAD